MGAFQSSQEELCNELLACAGGRAHLFAPDNYDGNKEPCDLAWVANGCVALFYMTETGGSLEKANKHNLEQAANWLKRWRRGAHRLVGKNDFRSFDIGPTDLPHLVVISVVGCPGQAGAYHRDHSRALGVTAVATLTQDDLAAIARVAGSLYDILLIVDGLRAGHPWTPAVCAEYTEESKRTAAHNFEVHGNAERTALSIAADTIIGMRGSERSSANNLGAAAIFSDLALVESCRFIYMLASVLQRVWLPPAGRGVGYVRAEFELTHYAVLIQIASSPKILKRFVSINRSDPNANPEKQLLRVMVISPIPDSALPTWALNDPQRPSQTEALLDEMKHTESLKE